MNRSATAVGNSATFVHVFSTDDPISGHGVWESRRVLQMPAGYDVFNVDVAAVNDGTRKFVMSIEVNTLAGNKTGSWAVIFAETQSDTPDAAWSLVRLSALSSNLEAMSLTYDDITPSEAAIASDTR
eukprot:SAG31_NODE_7132_length_1780_cov_2.946460_2_plen_127_part_00